MVPKRIDASCLAEPPPARALLSSSSEESSLSDPAADHSSASVRRRVPVIVGVSGRATSWFASLANGLVEWSSREVVGGENGWVWGTGGGAIVGGPESDECDIFLK